MYVVANIARPTHSQVPHRASCSARLLPFVSPVEVVVCANGEASQAHRGLISPPRSPVSSWVIRTVTYGKIRVWRWHTSYVRIFRRPGIIISVRWAHRGPPLRNSVHWQKVFKMRTDSVVLRHFLKYRRWVLFVGADGCHRSGRRQGTHRSLHLGRRLAWSRITLRLKRGRSVGA